MKKTLPLLILTITLAACTQTPQKEQTTNCSANKNKMKINLHVPIKIKPQAIPQFIATYKKCADESFKELGCIDYTLYQSPFDSTLFFLNETWINKEAHIQHMKTAHFDEYIKGIDGLTEEGDNRQFEEIYICPEANK